MADGGTVRSSRWLLAAVGLPLPGLILFVAYRFRDGSWAEAAQRLAGSPVSWMAVVVFVAFVVGRPGPPASVGKAIGWLAVGTMMCFSALAVDVIPIPGLEIVGDVVMVGTGMTFLGDGFRGVASIGKFAPDHEPV